jgi:hypothetical protein
MIYQGFVHFIWHVLILWLSGTPYVNIAYDNPKLMRLCGCTLDNPYFGVIGAVSMGVPLSLVQYVLIFD